MSEQPPSLTLETLYCEHHGWLHAWLRRRLGGAADAADLAHDTYVRIMVSGRTPPAGESRAHLTQIAKGLVVDLHRRRLLEASYLEALAQLPPSLAPSPEEHSLIIEALLRIDSVLDRLSAPVRETFLLSQLDGLTYSAIAVRLRISVGAVRKRMLVAARACAEAAP